MKIIALISVLFVGGCAASPFTPMDYLRDAMQVGDGLNTGGAQPCELVQVNEWLWKCKEAIKKGK